MIWNAQQCASLNLLLDRLRLLVVRDIIEIYIYISTHMTGLLHEGIFHVGGLIKPAIFDSLPWAYVMCNWAQILVWWRH